MGDIRTANNIIWNLVDMGCAETDSPIGPEGCEAASAHTQAAVRGAESRIGDRKEQGEPVARSSDR
jgi:hypothetical protein